MSKEMENQSFNERNSLTGNSGLLGLTSLRPTLQPVRVKALLEMYGSDEEESEDRGKESDSESEDDDIQPLPDDDEEAPETFETLETQSTPAKESNEKRDDQSHAAEEKIVNQQFEEQREQQNESQPKLENIQVIERVYTSESLQFTTNFSSDEQMRFDDQRSAKLSSDATSAGCYVGSSAQKSLIESSRGSNSKFKAPDLLYSANNKPSYPPVTSKSECTTHGSHSSAKSKFEPSEPTFYSDERHFHATNVAEPPATSAPVTVQAPTTNHHIMYSPHKNHPPVGSMRPNPSMSHRSIFQTPQSSKLHRQDYSKSHVQTPATIFSNWSQRNMAQTPMQSRSTIPPGDSARPQAPSILASQPPAATAGSTHETPWCRGTEEKKVRRPLTETMQSSSVNHQQHSQSEKLPNQHSADSFAASSEHHESPDNPQGRGVLESSKDKSSNKSAQQQQQQHFGKHESKENKYPPPLIDKLPTKEEEQGSGGHFESTKKSIGLSSNENVPNENRSEAARHVLENCDTPASRGARSNATAVSKNTAPAAAVEKNNVVCEKKANVQLSIPSSIRRPNQCKTMMVKGKEYLILGTLGEGMSGQVLRVQDLTSLELRAIKVVNLSRMDKDCAQGCLQEISMLHKLQAPCVVRMFDYEIQYPMVHVVMEMGDTDFRSLLHSMSEKNRLPLTMILYYWTEMLTAVKHIHDNGVIHSDLKPANFLLVRGRLKLIDFGIASSMNADMTSVVKNSPIGTLNYISPEAVMDIGGGGNGGDSPNQNVKYKITFKSDVWSLGCILYSLVYGYTPFHKLRAQWAKIQAITNPNPKISFALPTGTDGEPTPPILIDVMRKCLQHNPKARPTVTQLLQIAYIPTKPNSRTPIPDIPSNIVMKIRHSLTDDEWRQFTEIMEARRNES